MDTINLLPALRFLDEIRQNNNKTWFDQNRAAYEDARVNFERFIDSIIDELRESDHLQGLSARECIPRIYRDIRFSKDKSPYKTNLGAIIAPGGWKSTHMGYYISIGAQDQSLIAGGLYMPSPEQLNLFRRSVDQNAAGLKNITQSKSFIEQFGELEGQRLKTAPKGYEQTHPEIDLLRLKQVTVMHHFSDNQVLEPNFPDQALSVCRAMKPFLDYLNEILR